MTQTKTRITWVDMAKGYGMILVIISHLGIERFGFTRIYSFHMPLFFFLSGYVFRDKGSFRDFFVKKIRSIVVPYFCLGIPILISKAVNQHYSGDELLHVFLQFLVQKRLWTLWFLASLLWLNLFYFVIYRHCSKRIITGMCFVFPVLGLLFYSRVGRALPWNMDVFLMALPFFASGHYLSTHPQKIAFLTKTKFSTAFYLLLFLLLNFVCDSLSVGISGKILDMSYSSYGVPCLSYPAAFAGIFAMLIAAQLGTIEPIRYIGENSLLYFAWHKTIMIPITIKILNFCHFVLDESSSALTVFCYQMLQLAFILAAITVLNMIISNTRLRFMLGKK